LTWLTPRPRRRSPTRCPTAPCRRQRHRGSLDKTSLPRRPAATPWTSSRRGRPRPPLSSATRTTGRRCGTRPWRSCPTAPRD
ncbi:unnamed protein product, partial [Prorocentrum cordatum]